ncbi:bifunctional helix-turn-helix transcriptional regulator/GNAT family N-acetyltransferase [Jiella avicenniae]|uniref:Bifunctional helix-turn-helix transcriptional regulator/GNAT family N-acetyltransferase n=1 Tax=Jiella avicenniae TaxID=2907202 RepID=A0A9X1P3E2_9HYPH|nr:helix-turn-helix domain-containing GNAT family N-acetyltransferase [Jiella avicenniae]MCE7029768.1 bifunctional helix-turn-helix transcriptional regulator/GNAT family N-acetyltransferase [Jiella avicenniae]
MFLDPVSRFRRFARASVSEVGALDHSFLGRGRPLGVARVLNAIGHGKGDVSEIRAYLGLDSGLVSRMLRGLEEEGLVETTPDPADGRRRIVTLTPAGEAEFAAYEALSDDRARHALARHANPEALLAAMDLVASAFGRDQIALREVDPRSDVARYCLGEYYAELARRFERGFDVALSADPEAGSMIRPRGAFVVAFSDDMPVGCVGLKGTCADYAEVKRLWVAPAARGLGLAWKIMAQVEAIARELGVPLLRLDTNKALPEAVAMYRKSGWTEIDRFNDDPYPDFFFEKRL